MEDKNLENNYGVNRTAVGRWFCLYLLFYNQVFRARKCSTNTNIRQTFSCPFLTELSPILCRNNVLQIKYLPTIKKMF